MYLDKFPESLYNLMTSSGVINPMQEIYNLFVYIDCLIEGLEIKIDFNLSEYREAIAETKEECFNKSVGCHHRCPSCFKFCEKHYGHHLEGESKHSCSVYGHQYLSMGGKAWISGSFYPILHRCMDPIFKDDQPVLFGNTNMTYG